MDRSMLGSSASKSPFSPRARPSTSSKRLSSFRKSSRLSVSGKSTQSVQVVMKSSKNYVERFGQPLPVLITEALTFADRNTVISARISDGGYVWVVCGRRLLIWQYRQNTSFSSSGTPQRKGINQCFELQLPQSDLAHRAELVSVFVAAGSNTPACIAVSPEGLLRYWPAVTYEGVTVEQSVDLRGQECDSLTNIEGLGCILATTTCTVVLVQPQMNNGRHVLNCRPLKIPSGWLGGISKRMSSLIFGPTSSEQSSEPRLVRVLSIPNKEGMWTIYVLAGHSLQKWILSADEPEVSISVVSVSELSRLVRDSFHGAVWDNCVGDQAEIDTWLLDIQSDKDNIIILAAAVNMQISPKVHYAMISFSTEGQTAQIRNCLLLKMSGLYREDNPCDSLSYRFLLSGTQAYVYNLKTITVIRPHEEPDTLEFHSSQDFLLGGSICVNTPVFFSRVNGLVAIYSNEQMDVLSQSIGSTTAALETSLNDSGALNNLSVYNVDPAEIFNAHKDTIGQLKAAFIFFIKHQTAHRDIIAKLFPPESTSIPSLDNTLDKVVLRMGKHLLDDIPAGDPRWLKNTSIGIGSSYSMQVLYQLEDKQKAFWLYVKFLKDTDLWNRLSGSLVRDTPMATVHALGEMLEKIYGAIAMKSLPNSLLFENAIEKAIEDFETEPVDGLTNQDVFYREVTKVQMGLRHLVNCCEEMTHSELNPLQIAQVVHDTNEIVLAVLNEVVQHRHQHSDTFTPPETIKALNLEYLPWTAANGEGGLVEALLSQHSQTYNYGLKLVNQGQLHNSLLEQFIALTDLILDGRKCHLESLKNSSREQILYKQYCSDRHKLIKPLLDEKEWERAALLGEKYLDFETLVIVCDVTNNQKRIDEYLDRFGNEGFSDYAYNWYLKEKKQGKLMDKYRNAGKRDHVQKFSSFLKDHPSLLWMQQVQERNFAGASQTLYNLAMSETELLTRKKTMLSQCKLSALAGSNTTYIEHIDSQLALITFQEDIPDYVLQEFGYDTLRARVIPPEDLINLYISKIYSDAGELEFKKALDILNYISDEELKEELNLKIWRSAILRDSWDYKNLDTPLEVLECTLFFKVIQLSLVLGADRENLLPPMDVLLEDESMEELKENKNFLFLLKAGYESFVRMQIED